MLMVDSSGTSRIPSIVKLQIVTGILTMIIKIGKYLPYIVFTFTTFSLTLAILDFSIWDNVLFGLLNTIWAVGGLVLSGQLHQKCNIGRREYFTEGRHGIVNERSEEVQPRMSMTSKLYGCLCRVVQ